ncbi:T9SS type A sorting domain-containing protein [Hymenobacter sp. GOD-10R]|uniref:T9SS type A sorting domain-containing protein n=1 Tax=Hymenobacter sp. GOD-10R TaxID=3093922 RepID=UPI002D78431E|nr:T9SS type A sorting domain-containing protein [Hymenobacter sp. GOD-10R]WRQ27106.1 T9SS type A sorting domain-containing protein [Hymenobacter sp. GOD-10R]
MRYSKQLHRAFFLFFLLPLVGHAQTVAPLEADPSRTAPTAERSVRARGTALALPVFDDFTGREGQPNTQVWLARGGTLVNNRFPVAPPSRGVATFDGLNASGQPYGSAVSDTDTLTSQPIDLGGLTASAQVYLSFFWQAGSVVGAPSLNSSSRPVYLSLEFLDNTGIWRQVWIERSTRVQTAFQQQLIPVTDSRYLHNAFQFRFHSSGNQANTNDAWSIDYVYLNRDRSATNNSYRDIATSTPLTSLLKTYTAMPVWQYNASTSPTNLLNDNTSTTINNFDVGPANTPVTWTGTLQVLPSNAATTYLNGTSSLQPSQQQFAVTGSIRNTPLPISDVGKRVRHTITLLTNESNQRTLPNDTISRITELTDYYAYDDGTPEATVATSALSYLVYRFDLNKADQVKGLRLHMLPSPTATSRVLTIGIWDEKDGKPSGVAKATQAYTAPASPPANYVDINFPAPVPVSGSFYIGYAASGNFLQAALDYNSTVPANYILVSQGPVTATSNNWSASTLQGAIMMRPVLTNNIVVTATADAATAATFSVYPNPSSGLVQVQGSYRRATVLDAVGRAAWVQPAAQAGQASLNLNALPAGAYVLQLELPNGLKVTKRLILTE